MRATVTGRIVDSYTNIQTVKLFAHLEREDEHAREALAGHTLAYHSQTRLITLMNLVVSLGNSALMALTGAMSVWLWMRGGVTLVIVAESPPISGNYFYNPNGEVSEQLFKALMEQVGVKPKTKLEGLREFQNRGAGCLSTRPMSR